MIYFPAEIVGKFYSTNTKNLCCTVCSWRNPFGGSSGMKKNEKATRQRQKFTVIRNHRTNPSCAWFRGTPRSLSRSLLPPLFSLELVVKGKDAGKKREEARNCRECIGYAKRVLSPPLARLSNPQSSTRSISSPSFAIHPRCRTIHCSDVALPFHYFPPFFIFLCPCCATRLHFQSMPTCFPDAYDFHFEDITLLHFGDITVAKCHRFFSYGRELNNRTYE